MRSLIKVYGPVPLAPMSGVTDKPFRQIARRFGAGLVVSEMIASREMIRAAHRCKRMSTDCADEFPMIVQLAGHEPDVMAEAARLSADRGAAAVDINFGCPVKKVVNKLAGSALMREPDLATSIMDAVVRAVDLPVTVKMRLGWDDTDRNAPDLAARAEDVGVQMVTVHGRTRAQRYTGSADWAAIRPVVDRIGIPVIANGDIRSTADARQCLHLSHADGVMIGRAAQGRPWLPAMVRQEICGRVAPEPDPETKRRTVRDHYMAILDHYGSEKGVRIGRKHLCWYLVGTSHAAAWRDHLNRLTDPAAVLAAIEDAFAEPAGRLAA